MFSVEQTDLFNILKKTKGLLLKHGIQPVLACYKIEVANNSIKVTANNLDSQISGTCNARTEENLAFCIDGTKFTEIISLLHDVINFEVDNGGLIIKCGRTSYKMLILNADEFPKDMADFEYSSTALSNDFCEKIKQVLFCALATEMRNVISGVNFEIEDCKLNLAATDGNRLAFTSLSVEQQAENQNFVVPQKILSELVKDKYENIYLAYGDNKVMFIADNIMFVTKILDGVFPKYKQLIPKSFVGIAKAKTKEFKNALIKTCIMVDERTSKVEFKINRQSLRMSARSEDFGVSNDCIDINSNIDDEMTLMFNSKFIYDFLNVSKEEEIVLSLNGSNAAVMFKGDFDYLCMPLKS